MWRAQARAGHAASCIRRASTRRDAHPSSRASRPYMWTSDGGQTPNQARVPEKPSGALPCSHPAPTTPPHPRAESREGLGQAGSRPGFHVEGPEQKHLAPGGHNPTGLRRPAGVSGREAGRGSRCSEEERSPADMPAPTARPALARPRRDGSRLNLDRPKAEAPAPEPPDTAVPLSPPPQPGGHVDVSVEAGTHTPGPPGRSPGYVGEPAPGTNPLPPPGCRPPRTPQAAPALLPEREGSHRYLDPWPRRRPPAGGVSPTHGPLGWGRAPTEGIKQGHTVRKEVLVRAPSCPRAPGH